LNWKDEIMRIVFVNASKAAYQIMNWDEFPKYVYCIGLDEEDVGVGVYAIFSLMLAMSMLKAQFTLLLSEY